MLSASKKKKKKNSQVMQKKKRWVAAKQKNNPWRSLLERKEEDDVERRQRGRKRESLPWSLSTEADQRFVLCITMDIRPPILMRRPCGAAFTGSYLTSKQALAAWKPADIFSRFIWLDCTVICRMLKVAGFVQRWETQNKSNTVHRQIPNELRQADEKGFCSVSTHILLIAAKSAVLFQKHV